MVKGYKVTGQLLPPEAPQRRVPGLRKACRSRAMLRPLREKRLQLTAERQRRRFSPRPGLLRRFAHGPPLPPSLPPAGRAPPAPTHLSPAAAGCSPRLAPARTPPLRSRSKWPRRGSPRPRTGRPRRRSCPPRAAGRGAPPPCPRPARRPAPAGRRRFLMTFLPASGPLVRSSPVGGVGPRPAAPVPCEAPGGRLWGGELCLAAAPGFRASPGPPAEAASPLGRGLSLCGPPRCFVGKPVPLPSRALCAGPK